MIRNCFGLILSLAVFIFLFHFTIIQRAQAGPCITDSNCACDEFCGITLWCGSPAGYCSEGEVACGGPTFFDLYEPGFYYENHACIIHWPWSTDISTDPPTCDEKNNFSCSLSGGQSGCDTLLETCNKEICGAECKTNAECTAFPGGICSGCKCVYPPTPTPLVCPAPTNLVCTLFSSTEWRGDWTASVPVGNYRLRGCPSGQPPTSPSCTNGSLTSGTWGIVSVTSTNNSYDLYVRVENNASCSTPSPWSARAICPTY